MLSNYLADEAALSRNVASQTSFSQLQRCGRLQAITQRSRPAHDCISAIASVAMIGLPREVPCGIIRCFRKPTVEVVYTAVETELQLFYCWKLGWSGLCRVFCNQSTFVLMLFRFTLSRQRQCSVFRLHTNDTTAPSINVNAT